MSDAATLADLVRKHAGPTVVLSGASQNFRIAGSVLVTDDLRGRVEGDVPGETAELSVSWCNLGEGWSGEYDPDDPEDVNLLRFDVAVNDLFVDDASYCTLVPADASDADQVSCLARIYSEVWDAIESGGSVKRTCEMLSWSA